MQTDLYQVSLESRAPDLSPEDVEDRLVCLVDLLVEDASGLALGPAGSIHGSVLELLFTVEAVDIAELCSKLRELMLVIPIPVMTFTASRIEVTECPTQN